MKHALYSGSKNVYSHMAVAAKSLVANSDVDKVWFLAEDNDMGMELPDFCEVVNVSGQKFFPKSSANIKSRFSYMSLMRAALALMPELEGIDRILSLDMDTVAIRDCSGIWDMPIDDCYFSASREDFAGFKGMLYCNTGVALYNLEKLRDGKAEEVVHALNVRKYDNIEQDVFSFLCQGHIHDMPSEYNATAFTDVVEKPRIKHFAGQPIKEWEKDRYFLAYEKLSWEEALKMHEEACK